MNKNRKLLYFVLLIVSITFIYGCNSKDKKIILSQNVSKEINKQDKEINESIELGNSYLKQGKYKEARIAYENAISKDKLNANNYIKIKDKYIDKSRFDDAFYFIKLATTNNADVKNMNKILDEIKKKFEIINIENTIYKNDDYKLPDNVTLKINDEDVQGTIKWDNANANVNIKNVGTFTYQGKINQYGKTVQLKLTIKQITSNNGGMYVSYKGNVYYRQYTTDSFNSNWNSHQGYYYAKPGINKNMMCISEDGKSKIAFSDNGSGNIYILNNKMFLNASREQSYDYIYEVNLDGSNKHEICTGNILGVDEEKGIIVYQSVDAVSGNLKLYKLDTITEKSEEYKLSVALMEFMKISDGVIYYRGNGKDGPVSEWNDGKVKLCSVDTDGQNSKLLADVTVDQNKLSGVKYSYSELKCIQIVGDRIYFSFGNYSVTKRQYEGGQIATVNKDGSGLKILVGFNKGIQDDNACVAMDKFYVSTASGHNILYYTSALDQNSNYALDLKTGDVNMKTFVIAEEGKVFVDNNSAKIYLDSSSNLTTLIPVIDYSTVNAGNNVDLNQIIDIQICGDWVYYKLDANEGNGQYTRLKSAIFRKQLNGDKVEDLFEY